MQLRSIMMRDVQLFMRSVARRDRADQYLLTSLVSFAVTVIATRVFLQLTGFPQIGNDVLHFAHALWGGLMLFIAALLPLAFANRWALQASAYMSGIGIGLFIDEVGKFITQTNDYFYPPALSLIYGFFLLCVFLFAIFRRSYKNAPTRAIYNALEGLQEILEDDLDEMEASRIAAQLALAKRSDREEIVSLATSLEDYLAKKQKRLPAAEWGLWKRTARKVEQLGLRIGRRRHRLFISTILVMWLMLAVGYILILIHAGTNLDAQVLEWRGTLIGIQLGIGCLMLGASAAWFTGREDTGLKFGSTGFLLSLVGLQMHYFYISQFSAITAALLQFAFLQIMMAYRRWYVTD